MPPFSTEDFSKLLQKVVVLEMKIYCTEDLNAFHENETRLPQNSEKPVLRNLNA